jgi:polyisoprenoid-binding protein YceI
MKARSIALLALLAAATLLTQSSHAQVPVFEVNKAQSAVEFNVKASFTSTDVTTGVLDIKVQAASVNSGSGMKDGKLKSKDFFDAENDPLITFHSTQVSQTGPNTFEIEGDFTIRGVTKVEKLVLTLSGKGTGQGEVKGIMAFDRKDYGMNKGIPFVTIADRVEVNVDLHAKKISGPPLVFKK